MAESKSVSAEIRKTEDGRYELGGKIDGQFVSFYGRDAAEIDLAVSNAKENKKGSSQGGSGE